MRDSDIRDRLDVEDATSEEPTTRKYNQLDDLLIRITVLTGNLTKDWDLDRLSELKPNSSPSREVLHTPVTLTYVMPLPLLHSPPRASRYCKEFPDLLEIAITAAES